VVVKYVVGWVGVYYGKVRYSSVVRCGGKVGKVGKVARYLEQRAECIGGEQGEPAGRKRGGNEGNQARREGREEGKKGGKGRIGCELMAIGGIGEGFGLEVGTFLV
jgi:hypothetical protein